MRSVTYALLHPRPGAHRIGDAHPGTWWPPCYNRELLTDRLSDFEVMTIRNISSWVFQGVMS